MQGPLAPDVLFLARAPEPTPAAVGAVPSGAPLPMEPVMNAVLCAALLSVSFPAPAGAKTELEGKWNVKDFELAGVQVLDPFAEPE